MSVLRERRLFLVGLGMCFLSACMKRNPEPAIDPDREFNDWLKKKKRYRQFSTLDEARKAYDAELTQKDKEAEWKAYRKKHNLR